MAELNLTVTIPDDKVADVIDGLARQNSWTDLIEDGEGELVPNPVTKGQHVKDWILDVVKSSWKAYKDAEAKRMALENQPEDGSDFS